MALCSGREVQLRCQRLLTLLEKSFVKELSPGHFRSLARVFGQVIALLTCSMVGIFTRLSGSKSCFDRCANLKSPFVYWGRPNGKPSLDVANLRCHSVGGNADYYVPACR